MASAPGLKHGKSRKGRKMAGFMDRVVSGIATIAAALGPGSYEVGGKQVGCPHCGGHRFSQGSVELDNRWLYMLKCAECSRIEWFGDCPERLERSEPQVHQQEAQARRNLSEPSNSQGPSPQGDELCRDQPQYGHRGHDGR